MAPNAVNSPSIVENASDGEQRKYDLLADDVVVRTTQQGGVS
jgi:hypothetical protein